jgi:tryptophan-rich sensory protein
MTPNPISRQLLGLLGWLAVCFAAAALGGFASGSAGAFYHLLNRPVWAPPSWLFAPAWTLLYILMGVSAWLIWLKQGFRKARIILSLFLFQLLMNAIWTWLFFVWHLGSLAFGEILILWTLIVCTVVSFWRVLPIAGILLLPYLFWVTFASVLTYAIWQGNPALLS